MGESGALKLRDGARPRRARLQDLPPVEQFLRVVEPRTVTLGELAAEYVAQLRLAPGSDRAATVQLHVVDRFGAETDPRLLRAHRIDAWLEQYAAGGYTSGTRSKHLSALSCLLDYGRRTGALEHDPVAGVTPSLRPTRRSKDPHRSVREALSVAEVRTIVESRAIRPLDRLLWTVLLLTGARIGEAIGLSWEDWDQGASPLGRLTIARQWHTRSQSMRPTKDGGVREVPVHPALRRALVEARRLFFARFGRYPEPHDPICAFDCRSPRRDSIRWTACTARLRWAEDLEALGMRADRTLHSTRHTFVSLLVNAGAPERPARSLTHAVSGGNAYERYVHLSWEAKCAAVMMLDLGGKTE